MCRAKLNIAFPTPATLVLLRAAIREMPDDPESVAPEVLTDRLTDFLTATSDMPSVGFRPAVCMLAVLKSGKYAPIDQKVANGLSALSIFDDSIPVNRMFTRGVEPFVRDYVNFVLPAWFEATRRQSPREVDEEWARHGLNAASR